MKDMNVKVKCPYCGNEEGFTEAKARFVSPVDDGFHGSVLYHLICLGCGTVVRSYIKDITPFVKKD
jgi:uncharacterized Zn finger protein